MEQLLLAQLLDMAQKYPVGMSVLLGIGVLRAVFKPIMAVLHAYVDATPKLDDNEILGKLEASKAYKALAFLVDYAASIKLPGANK